MTRKEQKIKKQAEKLRAKKEREDIVNSYLKKIQDIIEQGYLDMSESLEKFNKELEQSALQYVNTKTQIKTLLKSESFDMDKLDELLNTISEMEKKNDEFYETIVSRDLNKNKLLKHLPIIAEKVADVIRQSNDDLNGIKNQVYVVSMITNRSLNMFKNYNGYISDTALESNDYIDMYIDTRENFLDFIDSMSKKESKTINYENIQEAEIIIKENIKYNQRLRVEYSELCDFLKYKGYECDRQGSTTHAVWKHLETGHSVPLPNKSGTIPQGTASKILKQIGSNRSELASYLYA